MDTRSKNRKISYYAKKYWTARDADFQHYTAYAIAQDMKKAGICKYDMDCYRKLLAGVEKKYRG